MPYFIITSSNVTPRYAATMPTAAQAEEPFRLVPDSTRPGVIWGTGRLIGARGRITRSYDPASFGRITTIAWLYEFPSAEQGPGSTVTASEIARFETERQQRLIGNIQDNQRRSGVEWTRPELSPYSPQRDGTVEWWASGQASNTLTRDAIQEDVQENPTGPNLNLPTRIPTSQLIDTVAKTVMVVAVVGGLVYLAGPLLRAGSETAADMVRTRRRV